MKSDTATYPRMMSKAGVPIDVLSPNAPANLDADRTAFAALMRHLKQADPQHTVLMMQVENESGSLGLVRDFSPLAQKHLRRAGPRRPAQGAQQDSPGTWAQVFGDDADETFAAWSVSRYINAVAAAGKQELAAADVRQQLAEEPARLSRHHRSRRRLSQRRPDHQHVPGLEGDGARRSTCSRPTSTCPTASAIAA